MQTKAVNQPEDAFPDAQQETIDAIDNTVQTIADDMGKVLALETTDQLQFYVDSVVATIGGTIGSWMAESGAAPDGHKAILQSLADALCEGYTQGVNAAEPETKH